MCDMVFQKNFETGIMLKYKIRKSTTSNICQTKEDNLKDFKMAKGEIGIFEHFAMERRQKLATEIQKSFSK